MGGLLHSKATEPNVLQHASSMEDIDVNFSRHLRTETQSFKTKLGLGHSMTKHGSLTVVSGKRETGDALCKLEMMRNARSPTSK